MNSLLTINYLNMNRLDSTDSLIKSEFTLLNKQYQLIKSCLVSVANVDYLPKFGSCYQVGINLKIQPNHSFFVVRDPDFSIQTELVEFVVTDAFKILGRQLNEIFKIA